MIPRMVAADLKPRVRSNSQREQMLLACVRVTPMVRLILQVIHRLSLCEGAAWKSQKWIGQMLGTSESSVRKHLKEAERLGLIEAERRGIGECRKEYRILFDSVEKLVPQHALDWIDGILASGSASIRQPRPQTTNLTPEVFI